MGKGEKKMKKTVINGHVYINDDPLGVKKAQRLKLRDPEPSCRVDPAVVEYCREAAQEDCRENQEEH